MNISVLLEMESFLSKLDKMDKKELERVFLNKKAGAAGDYGWKKLTRTETCSNINEVAEQLAATKDRENASSGEENSKEPQTPFGVPHAPHRHYGSKKHRKAPSPGRCDSPTRKRSPCRHRTPNHVKITEADILQPSGSNLGDVEPPSGTLKPKNQIYLGSPLAGSGRRIITESDAVPSKEDVNI